MIALPVISNSVVDNYWFCHLGDSLSVLHPLRQTPILSYQNQHQHLNLEANSMSKEFKRSDSVVDRFRSAQGKDVPIDYFLYACFETEQTMEAVNRTIQWPHLQDLNPEEFLTETEDHELLDVWEDLMSWYAANYPEFSANAWDFETLAEVVPALVAMAKDLAQVHKLKLNEDIPEFDPECDIQPKAWQLLERLVNQFFSKKAQLILRYLEWNFAKERKELVEPGSRPPVGRFAPNRNFNRPSNDRKNDRRGSRDKNFKNRKRGGPPRKDRGGRNGGKRHPNHRRPPKKDADLEKRALADADQAIDYLRSHPDEERVILKPQNSFYRRLQHQTVVDEGFHSESIGEGSERAVVVYRGKK